MRKGHGKKLISVRRKAKLLIGRKIGLEAERVVAQAIVA